MKRFREHVLIETVTESATNTEKALCYYHNLRVFEGLADAEESAMQLAQIDGVPQLKKVLMKASIQENNKEAILNSMAVEKVAKLKHTVKTKQKPNEKWLGRDGSFKSDVVEGDEKKRRFSVKSGEARLLGAKRDEAKATFQAAYEHQKANSQGEVVPLALKEEIKKALKNMITKMDFEGDVEKLKSTFKDWYLTKSGRSDVFVNKINKKTNRPFNDRDIQTHMKHELFHYKLVRGQYLKRQLLGGDETHLVGDEGMKTYMREFFNSKELLDFVAQNQEQRKRAIEIVQNAFDSKIWQDSLRSHLEDKVELKRWIVYEAASGHYKFSGEPRTPSGSVPNEEPIATHFLQINDNGVKISTVYAWATPSKATELVSKISINFKGGSDGKWNIVALSAQESKVEEIILEGLFDYIRTKVNQAVTYVKKIASDVVDYFTELYESLKNIVISFYENYIVKMIDYVVNLLDRGVDVFLDFLGYEIEGSFS